MFATARNTLLVLVSLLIFPVLAPQQTVGAEKIVLGEEIMAAW